MFHATSVLRIQEKIYVRPKPSASSEGRWLAQPALVLLGWQHLNPIGFTDLEHGVEGPFRESSDFPLIQDLGVGRIDLPLSVSMTPERQYVGRQTHQQLGDGHRLVGVVTEQAPLTD